MVSITRIRPTRRGVGVASIVILAFVFGITGGTEALGAVVVSGAVALVAGFTQLAHTGVPSITRSAPAPGFPGEVRTVTVSVDSKTPATVVESLPEVISPDANRSETTTVTETVGHGGHFEYTIEPERRGEHQLGPARCRLFDSLGLFRAVVETEGTTAILVYPEVYELNPEPFSGLERRVQNNDRATFERLREFTSEDTLRDIHWRASAKHPNEGFVVSEYGVRSARSNITIVGEASPGSADAMAATVASVAIYLASAGLTATLEVPGGETIVRPARTVSALRLLAVTEAGDVTSAARQEADIYVRGASGSTTVRVSDREFDFGAFAGDVYTPEVLA
jgi:uncharacterized protein (DUF58 family)